MTDEKPRKPGLRIVKTDEKSQKTTISGGRLIDMLKRRAEKNQGTMNDIAAHLGISPSYLSAIFRNVRPISGMSREAFVNAARYLNLPVTQIYLLADVMTLNDFVTEQDAGVICERVHDAMCLDPKWAGYVPAFSTWTAMPMSMKILIGLLYEASGGPRFSELKTKAE